MFGAGPVGLLCMAVAKALGARRVIAVDIQQERLDFAKSYAATDIYLPVSYSPLSNNPKIQLMSDSEPRSKMRMPTSTAQKSLLNYVVT